MIYKLMYKIYFSTNLSCYKVYKIEKMQAYAYLLRYFIPKLSDPKYLTLSTMTLSSEPTSLFISTPSWTFFHQNWNHIKLFHCLFTVCMIQRCPIQGICKLGLMNRPILRIHLDVKSTCTLGYWNLESSYLIL